MREVWWVEASVEGGARLVRGELCLGELRLHHVQLPGKCERGEGRPSVACMREGACARVHACACNRGGGGVVKVEVGYDDEGRLAAARTCARAFGALRRLNRSARSCPQCRA